MNIKQLRQAQADARNKAKAIHTAAVAANRRTTADENTQFDALIAEANGYDADIARAQAVLDIERTAPAVDPAPAATVGHNNAEDRPWAHLGEQMLAIKAYAKTNGRVTDPRLLAALGQNETIDAEGGFLVTPEVAPDLLTRTFASDPITSRCRTRPMASSRLVLNGIDDSNRVGGPAGAGIQVYRVAEAAAVTRSMLKFRRVEFNANKLMGLYYATDEVLEDAGALQAEINDYFPEAFSWRLANEVLNGTGVGQFLGISVSGATVVVPKTAGQAAGTFTAQNALDMRTRFWVRSRMNGVWITGPDVEASLAQLVLPANTGTAAALYTPPGINGNNTPYGMMFNMPVIPVEQTAAFGTQGDILLADFSQYVIGERSGIKFATSIHVAFNTDEQAFRWTLRNDGQPLWDKPVTQNNSANKVSPFVTLATRA